MIIPTGSIQVITLEGGGFDHGRPVRPTERRSAHIAANIRRTSRRMYDTGSQAWVTRQGYTILIDADAASPETIRKVALTDSRGRDLGEFTVEDAQPLDHVGAIEITI